MSGCRRCQHTFTNGSQCQSPALKDFEHCYFHERERHRQQRLSANRDSIGRNAAANRVIKFPRTQELEIMYDDECAATMDSLDLPILEDADAIQMTLSTVVRALATQQIHFRAAALILYALQTAAYNLPNTSFAKSREHGPVRSSAPEHPSELEEAVEQGATN